MKSDEIIARRRRVPEPSEGQLWQEVERLQRALREVRHKATWHLPWEPEARLEGIATYAREQLEESPEWVIP